MDKDEKKPEPVKAVAVIPPNRKGVWKYKLKDIESIVSEMRNDAFEFTRSFDHAPTIYALLAKQGIGRHTWADWKHKLSVILSKTDESTTRKNIAKQLLFEIDIIETMIIGNISMGAIKGKYNGRFCEFMLSQYSDFKTNGISNTVINVGVDKDTLDALSSPPNNIKDAEVISPSSEDI